MSVLTRILNSSAFRFIVTIIAAAVFVLYAVVLFIRLAYPGYFDHIEPTVASVSWLAIHGKPIYPGPATDGAYGMIYGPLLYLLNGLFLLIAPSIFMSKLPGVLAFVASIGLFAWTLWKKGFGRLTAFIFAAVLLTALMPDEFYPYSNRSDSFLLLFATLALVLASGRPVVLGMLAGLAASLKLHGFLYVLPVIFQDVAKAKTARIALERLGIAAAAAFAVFLTFHHNVSMIEGYERTLLAATHHGLARDLVEQDAWRVVDLLVPLTVLIAWRRPRLAHEDISLIAGLIVVSFALIVIGGKPGNGPHHLLPLTPIVLYAIAICPRTRAKHPLPVSENAVAGILLIAALLTFRAPGIDWGHQVLKTYANAPEERLKIAELQHILDRYPNAEMGAGDNQHYGDMVYRPIAVYRGAPMHLDIPAWMDMTYGGVPQDKILWMVDTCRVPVWVLPGGEPFSMDSFYTGKPLFSDRFRQEFAAQYKLVWSGDFYRVWVCS